MLERVLQHRIFCMNIGMNEVWEISNNTFGKYKQKFNFKLHIESLLVVMKDRFICLYMLSAYSVLNKCISKPSEI